MGFNLEISVSQTDSHTNVTEPCLPYYLPIAWGDRLINTFPKGISPMWNPNSHVQYLNLITVSIF